MGFHGFDYGEEVTVRFVFPFRVFTGVGDLGMCEFVALALYEEARLVNTPGLLIKINRDIRTRSGNTKFALRLLLLTFRSPLQWHLGLGQQYQFLLCRLQK